MNALVACNLASYGPYRHRAYAHLAEMGVKHVEIQCPDSREAQGVRQELEDHSLSASSLIVPCQMDADDVVVRFAHALQTVAEFDVKTVFTSVKTGELDLDYVYGRLQNIGDAAAEWGVTVALETHPDLVTNADVALATMSGVAHPNVGVNFDTANLYYYNEGVDAVSELRRIVDHVGAVHLKDTNGEYRTWHFPALGQGIVDFTSIFDILRAASFSGPMTLEIEGIEGESLTEAEVCARVEQSLSHLKALGVNWNG